MDLIEVDDDACRVGDPDRLDDEDAEAEVVEDAIPAGSHPAGDAGAEASKIDAGPDELEPIPRTPEKPVKSRMPASPPLPSHKAVDPELGSLSFPAAVIKRIARSAAPPGVRFNPEALAGLHRVAQTFILYATEKSLQALQSEADLVSKAQKKKGVKQAPKKTLGIDHVMRFLSTDFPAVATKIGTCFPELVPDEHKPEAVRLLEQLHAQKVASAMDIPATAAAGGDLDGDAQMEVNHEAVFLAHQSGGVGLFGVKPSIKRVAAETDGPAKKRAKEIDDVGSKGLASMFSRQSCREQVPPDNFTEVPPTLPATIPGTVGGTAGLTSMFAQHQNNVATGQLNPQAAFPSSVPATIAATDLVDNFNENQEYPTSLPRALTSPVRGARSGPGNQEYPLHLPRALTSPVREVSSGPGHWSEMPDVPGSQPMWSPERGAAVSEASAAT